MDCLDGLECNHNYSLLQERCQGRDDPDRRGEGNVTTEAETEGCSQTPRNTGSHQKLEEARTGLSPRTQIGEERRVTAQPWQHLVSVQ